MRRRQSDSTWQAPQPFLWPLVRNNFPVVLFLALAVAGMLAVRWYFTPPAGGSAQTIVATGNDDTLSAPIYKAVSARPVRQRFAQTPGPLHVAVVAGHRENDAGAVCEDGLTEAEINFAIAQKVVGRLQAAGIPADIFTEFDPRLAGYSGTALVSIHADSCDYVNELATGFKVSGSWVTDSEQLATCVTDAYQRATGLPFHANTITADMTDYHAFREIAPGVQAVIIEVGFMNLDRELLTERNDLPAEGIVDGVNCFLRETGALEVRSQ